MQYLFEELFSYRTLVKWSCDLCLESVFPYQPQYSAVAIYQKAWKLWSFMGGL